MTNDSISRQKEIEGHLRAIKELQAETSTAPSAGPWQPEGYYVVWHVLYALGLGSVAAAASLLFNVLGAPLFGKHSLELIRIYLTFPMGEKALTLEPGFALFAGCLLYLATGALYGVLFHLVMTTWLKKASGGKRFLSASLLGLGLWVVNFYLILSWLQPELQGYNWIVRLVPVSVGAITHLIFAWTMLVGEIWGDFEPVVDSRLSGGAR